MAKAKKDKPLEAKDVPPGLLGKPIRRIAREDAIELVMKKLALRDPKFAERELFARLLDGRLHTEWRCIDKKTNVDYSGCDLPRFWGAGWEPFLHMRWPICPLPFHDIYDEPCVRHFFLDEIDWEFPAFEAPQTGVSETPVENELLAPPIRPGPKPKDDWYTAIGAFLIQVAADNPKRFRHINVLIGDARSFLKKQKVWAPKDDDQIRDKIVEHLKLAGIR